MLIDKITYEKLQYDINRKAAKISTSGKTDEHGWRNNTSQSN